jgi:hypothetical protein
MAARGNADLRAAGAGGFLKPVAVRAKIPAHLDQPMKSMALALLLSVTTASADSTNLTVQIAGKTQTTFEIEQLVKSEARQARMQFDFSGVRPHFTVLTNSPAVISMWCARTNGFYFYAAVDNQGRVHPQELTPQDAGGIKTLLAKQTTNAVSQVWLGPDGRVGARTIQAGDQTFELFWLQRTRTSWTIQDHGRWKTSPPAIPAPEMNAAHQK